MLHQVGPERHPPLFRGLRPVVCMSIAGTMGGSADPRGGFAEPEGGRTGAMGGSADSVVGSADSLGASADSLGAAPPTPWSAELWRPRRPHGLGVRHWKLVLVARSSLNPQLDVEISVAFAEKNTSGAEDPRGVD